MNLLAQLVRSAGDTLRHRASKNLAMYMAYQALRYVAPAVLTPFLAHTLGKQQFADLVILNSCILTSTVFMEFGFYLYGVSKTAAAENREELSRTITAITFGKVVLAPAALAAYIGLAAWAGLLVRNPQVVMIGALSALGYGASFAWYFQGQQRGGLAVVTEGVPQLVYYALVVALVRGPGDLPLAVLAQTLPPVASLGIGIFLVRRGGLFGAFAWPAVRSALGEAFPYFVERFCFTLYTAVTPTLVAVLSIPSEASYYSIGDRFGIFLGTLTTPVFQAAVPLLSKTIRGRTGGWGLSLGFVAGTTSLVGAAAVCVYFSAGYLIRRFFSSDYHPAILVARLFCVTSVLSVLGMALANFVIIPRNRAKIMIWSSSIALVGGLAVQMMLVPRLGAVGAVLSRGTSEMIVALILGWATCRLFLQERRKLLLPALSGDTPIITVESLGDEPTTLGILEKPE